MTQAGRRTRTPHRAQARASGALLPRTLLAPLVTLVVGLALLGLGASSLSRPDAQTSPWGPAGGVIAGPILVGIAVAELIRRWARNRRRTGRHAGS